MIRRLNAPDFWRISKKEYEYVAKPIPGPHPGDNCFTIIYFLRDLLKVARSAVEVKKILNNGGVLVDGKARKDMHFPLGLMDIVEIPAIGKTFRMMPDAMYNLKPVEVTKDKEYKLCKIINKKSMVGGHIQLNLHDGRSIIIKVKDPAKPKEDVYKTNDVVQIDLKSGKIADHIKFEKGKLAIVHAGINNGRKGKITKITSIIKNDVATLDEGGIEFETKMEYVFVLGDDKPVIAVGL